MTMDGYYYVVDFENNQLNQYSRFREKESDDVFIKRVSNPSDIASLASKMWRAKEEADAVVGESASTVIDAIERLHPGSTLSQTPYTGSPSDNKCNANLGIDALDVMRDSALRGDMYDSWIASKYINEVMTHWNEIVKAASLQIAFSNKGASVGKEFSLSNLSYERTIRFSNGSSLTVTPEPSIRTFMPKPGSATDCSGNFIPDTIRGVPRTYEFADPIQLERMADYLSGNFDVSVGGYEQSSCGPTAMHCNSRNGENQCSVIYSCF
ncbi:hypothetical protein GCM10025776_02410 [Corallincola platygyrae]